MPYRHDFSVGKNPEEEKQIACATCVRITSHKVLTTVEEYGETEDGFRFWEYHWIIQCLGCKSVSFCTESANTDDMSFDEHGEPFLQPTIKLFPSRLVGRKKIEFAGDVPHSIYRTYEEVHAALCNNLNVLAAIGVRAIVETICKENGLEKGNLASKIDGLVSNGVITAAGAKILHNLRFMGNDAAHEVKAYKTEQLVIAMDVIEHLLLGVYVLPEDAKKLLSSNPAPAILEEY